MPTVPATNTAALTAADNSAAAASKAMEGPKAGNSEGNPSVIIVEVLGYGGGDGDADDRSLLKPDQRSYNSADPIRIVGYGPLGLQETQGLTAEEQQKLSRQRCCGANDRSRRDERPICARACSTAFGLSALVCTIRLDYITRFVDALDVGCVNVWEVPGYRTELTPFGGIKDSGLGHKEGVLEAIKSFTNIKTYSLPW